MIRPEAILRYIVTVHFVWTSMVHTADWMPFSYTLNQLAIIVLGVWAIVHRDSALHVELLMVMKSFTIILDAIVIGMYFQMGRRNFIVLDHSSYFGISAFFAISLLILKPVMLYFLYNVRKERLGDYSTPKLGDWGTHAGQPAPVPGYIPVPDNQTV